MVERLVPVAEWRVHAPGGDGEDVRGRPTQVHALDVEDRGVVLAELEDDLGEHADLVRERRGHEGVELPERESVRLPLLVDGEVHVAEPADGEARDAAGARRGSVLSECAARAQRRGQRQQPGPPEPDRRSASSRWPGRLNGVGPASRAQGTRLRRGVKPRSVSDVRLPTRWTSGKSDARLNGVRWLSGYRLIYREFRCVAGPAAPEALVDLPLRRRSSTPRRARRPRRCRPRPGRAGPPPRPAARSPASRRPRGA